MRQNRRPLLVLATVVVASTLLSACIVVPRGHYRYYRHADASAPAPAPQAAPTAAAVG